MTTPRNPGNWKRVYPICPVHRVSIARAYQRYRCRCVECREFPRLQYRRGGKAKFERYRESVRKARAEDPLLDRMYKERDRNRPSRRKRRGSDTPIDHQ